MNCPRCNGDYQEICDVNPDALENAVQIFALCCRCGATFDAPSERRREAASEAVRIQDVLNKLDETFAEGGVVRTVLRARIEQEHRRAQGLEP